MTPAQAGHSLVQLLQATHHNATGNAAFTTRWHDPTVVRQVAPAFATLCTRLQIAQPTDDQVSLYAAAFVEACRRDVQIDPYSQVFATAICALLSLDGDGLPKQRVSAAIDGGRGSEVEAVIESLKDLAGRR